MCGIVGCVSRRNVRDLLLEGLRRLEYRGYDSAGIAVLEKGEGENKGGDKNKFHHHRVCGKVEVLTDALQKHRTDGCTGIAHTRWATHGGVTENNAHPHLAGGRVALVHNGIVENYRSFRDKLQKQGYKFSGETDSEVVAVLIYDHLQRGRSLSDALERTVRKLEGAFAFAVLDLWEPDCLIGIRKGAPLVVGVGSEENFLASDPLALLQVTDRFIYLEDEEMAILGVSRCEIRKVGGGRVRPKVEIYKHGPAAVDRGDYGHFMLKEIYEQPETVVNTLTGRLTKRHFLPQTLGETGMEILERTKNMYLVGCGTAYHAGLTARYWFEEHSDLTVRTEVASEFRYMRKNILPDSLYVTISQSGETADVLEALRSIAVADKINRPFLASLAICNVPASSVIRACDIPLLISAGPEIGVASTKAFTAQLIGLLILLGFFMQIRGDSDGVRKLIAALESLPRLIEKTLALRPKIVAAAELLADKDSVLFIGRGPLMPLAMEGALKLKEISYIHAESYPGGELKHGPLALVDEKTPTVVLTGSGIRAAKIKSNMQEIVARRGPLLVFAEGRGDKEIERIADELIVLPHAKGAGQEMIMPIVYGVATQLLAYEVALRLGTDIDKPRNLAKSVTVE